jgi:hypothetical protein
MSTKVRGLILATNAILDGELEIPEIAGSPAIPAVPAPLYEDGAIPTDAMPPYITYATGPDTDSDYKSMDGEVHGTSLIQYRVIARTQADRDDLAGQIYDLLVLSPQPLAAVVDGATLLWRLRSPRGQAWYVPMGATPDYQGKLYESCVIRFEQVEVRALPK